MRNLNEEFGRIVKDVPLDYSDVLGVNTNDPKPDPFIKRYAGRTYYDPWEGIDYTSNDWMQKNKAIERALWVFTSGSQTVPIILPTFLDPEYTYMVPSDAPAYAALPRKASLGAMSSFVKITALAAPTSIWVSEAEASSPEHKNAPTEARVNLLKAICEVFGGVSGFQRAAGEGFKDMLAEAHRERLLYLMTEGLENGVLNGTGANNQCTGLLTSQSTTNGVNASSTAVTLARIQEAIRNAWDDGGDLESYGFAITDNVTYDYVKNLVAESLGYVNIENYSLPWGVKTYTIQGIPVLKSRKMPTSTNTKIFAMFDRRYCYVDVLTDVTTELYGKTADDQKFAIKWYGNVINRAPNFNATVYGIA
jgi:hypothetical protein